MWLTAASSTRFNGAAGSAVALTAFYEHDYPQYLQQEPSLWTRSTPSHARETISYFKLYLNMAGKEICGLTQLKDLAPSNKIYQGVNKHGWLLLRSNLVCREKEFPYAVMERHLIALALTKVCWLLGLSKVRTKMHTSIVALHDDEMK